MTCPELEAALGGGRQAGGIMNYLTDPSYAPLLRSVLETPADDAPRLVLADWLLEHPDPVAQQRGRAIIDSVAGKSIRRADARVLLAGLERSFRFWRATEYLSELVNSWDGTPDQGEGRRRDEHGVVTLQLKRGFVHSVGQPAAPFWFASPSLVFRQHPVVEVGVSGSPPRLVRNRRSGRVYVVYERRRRGHLGDGVVPAELFPFLRSVRGWDYESDRHVGVRVDRVTNWGRLECDRKAESYLEEAIIQWGRQRAGLGLLAEGRK